VVSFQGDEVGWEGITDKAIQHASGIWAAVHIVANRDSQALADGVALEVTGNLIDHLVKEVRSAMNVADNINSRGIPDDQRWRHDRTIFEQPSSLSGSGAKHVSHGF
jgi:hypothetical protein